MSLIFWWPLSSNKMETAKRLRSIMGKHWRIFRRRFKLGLKSVVESALIRHSSRHINAKSHIFITIHINIGASCMVIMYNCRFLCELRGETVDISLATLSFTWHWAEIIFGMEMNRTKKKSCWKSWKHTDPSVASSWWKRTSNLWHFIHEFWEFALTWKLLWLELETRRDIHVLCLSWLPRELKLPRPKPIGVSINSLFSSSASSSFLRPPN
jgi:hypothetical protein